MQWPDRDPMTWDGASWPAGRGRRTPDMVTHHHACPDGTPVVVTSQLIVTLGRVVDRWTVHGWRIAVTSRDAQHETSHHTPPDTAWIDDRMQPEVAA